MFFFISLRILLLVLADALCSISLLQTVEVVFIEAKNEEGNIERARDVTFEDRQALLWGNPKPNWSRYLSLMELSSVNDASIMQMGNCKVSVHYG